MGVEIKSLENEADQILAESVESFFEEDQVDNQAEEVKDEATEEVAEEVQNNDETEEVESDDVEDEVTEEVVGDKEITDKKEIDLNESLRGVFNKEYIDLLESVEDPKLRDSLIEAGKKQRADLDRKRLDLGESKKLVETLDEVVKANGLNYNRQQYADVVKNFMSFDALFSKDPKLAIENLAKTANIDLNTLGNNPVQEVKQSDDYDDYRTPEEIKRDQEIETLKQELNYIKNHKQQQEQISVQQEINDFASTRDESGNLKYPHFERVKQSMGLFFNDSNPEMTLDKAYHKAIRLDDELFEQEKVAIEKRAELKRKAEIEKAKKLKRQSVRSSKVSATSTNPDTALRKIVNDFYA